MTFRFNAKPAARRAHPTGVFIGLGLSLSMGLVASAWGQSSDATYLLTAGFAHARYNVSSSDLTGPPGTTPPGARLDVENLNTLGAEATVNFDAHWSATFAFGYPPRVKFKGDGAAAPLGRVGTARAWYPALLGGYRFNPLGPVQPYIAAGVNYTFFSDVKIGDNFTSAFGGTSSSGKIQGSFGPIVKLGLLVPVADQWVVNAGWARYGIRSKASVTTDTPGLGPIERKLTLRSDPDVFSILVGRSF